MYILTTNNNPDFLHPVRRYAYSLNVTTARIYRSTTGSGMMLRILCLLLLCILSGCGMTEKFAELIKSDEDNAEPPAPLVEFRQRLNVIELWSEKTGKGTDEQYLQLTPVIANQRLYIVDINGNIKAMDATNGQTIWSKKMKNKVAGKLNFWANEDNERITGGPGYGEKTLLIGTSEGQVIAISSDSGDEIWRTKVTSEVLSAPQKQNNIVIARTLDGKVFALNGDNGRRLWIYDRTVPTLTLRGTSTPVIYENIVIAGFDGGRLATLDLQTGRLLWEIRITTSRGSTPLEKMVDIDSTPIVINGIIYVVTYQGNLTALQLDTGRILWTREVSSYAGISADEDNIYVTDEDSHLWAFERFTGNSVWKQDKLHARGVTASETIGDYLVVGDFEGYLHWIDKKTGKFVARNRLSKNRILAKPIVVGKFLYAYCSDGKLAAYTYR